MTAFILLSTLLLMQQPDSSVTLRGVTVSARSAQQAEASQPAVEVDACYLDNHFSSSLVQSLERIPGVKAQSIGSGQSKPTIRGMGFNRMVVSENGIKHEGQQWGDDHGLEMDQNAIDAVEVVKGPAALLYGSDAIGGVLALKSNAIPTSAFEGSASLFGNSSSDLLGMALRLGGRSKGFFWKAVASWSDYADARVPTDSIQYYSYQIRLPHSRLRNTAGNEVDGRLTLGWTNNENFRTDLTVSDVYCRSGFFADAHGLEVRLSRIDYNRSNRDVDLPSQWVNHLKVHSHSTLQLGALWLEGHLAWQHNLREEMSEPLSHGYMPTPPDSLERRFDKHTATGGLAMKLPIGESHQLSAGSVAELQRNRRSGWGFILPDFEARSWGLYLMDHWHTSEQLTLNGGLRFDAAHTDIHAYRDWYSTPVAGGGEERLQCSSELSRTFSSLTWSVGANWHSDHWLLRANLGKAFRVPIAKELGADGINYHIFRYEQGNPTLDPEQSYQLDAGVEWSRGAVALKVDPYLNYFPNYIYLCPTYEFVEGLQLYRYTQTEVLRWGLELEASLRLSAHWETSLRGYYCYARQQSGGMKGYTLPFSVPLTADAEVQWMPWREGDGAVTLNLHIVGAQEKIVPPEKPTPAFFTLNIAFSRQFTLGGHSLSLSLQANNLLNDRHYDHSSYYRLIDVPEPGRHVAIKMKINL